MEQTESTDVESRLASLEKSLQTITERQSDAGQRLANISREMRTTAEILRDIYALVQRAAPLLDSPMARMAQSPAAGVMTMLRGGRRG